jgi:hypothetical protein
MHFFGAIFRHFSFKSQAITESYSIIRLAQFMLTIKMLKCINEQQIESQLKFLGE